MIRQEVMKIIKITTSCHRGSLEDSIRTERVIEFHDFIRMVDQYNYYCYDERIRAYRMLIKDLKNNYTLGRDWLNIYVGK